MPCHTIAWACHPNHFDAMQYGTRCDTIRYDALPYSTTPEVGYTVDFRKTMNYGYEIRA